MRFLTLLLTLILAACADGEPPVTTLSLGEANYRVPDEHIVSVSSEPHQLVRIKPPERSFELVYDSRTAGQTDRFGWPAIFGLNDERAPNVDRYARGDLVVVCQRAPSPKGGCGLKVKHRGAEWTVLFPNAQAPAAHLIRQRALAVLAGYQA